MRVRRGGCTGANERLGWVLGDPFTRNQNALAERAMRNRVVRNTLVYEIFGHAEHSRSLPGRNILLIGVDRFGHLGSPPFQVAGVDGAK